jgi:tetratricopeptide (TPR) repeat protein
LKLSDRGTKIISFLVLLFFSVSVTSTALNELYVTIRKFLSARMYGEAYMELLRNEITSDEFDPKLQKLRIDLLDRTEKRLLKQAKINPDDSAIFIILADIYFHKGNLDKAVENINIALRNRSGALANYVFAKILFRKGNIQQAYDQMSNVLESMPDSSVVFADFQFLYSCQSYGVATAKKIVKNTNFLKRATPLVGDDMITEAPVSPFDNDPTQPPEVIQPEDPAEIVQVPDEPSPDPTFPDPSGEIDKPVDDVPLPDEIDDFPDLPDVEDPNDIDIDRPVPIGPAPTPDPEPTEKKDPIAEKIEKADYWMDQANKQYKNRNYDDAKLNLEKAIELYPDVEGKDELSKKLKTKFSMFERYKIARGLFDEGKFEKALPGILEAYNQEPGKFKEAPFYIGKIYLLKPEPEKEKALNYFETVLKDPDLDPLFKRDLEWTILEVLFELERYKEADKLFQYFVDNELDFAKNQPDFNQLKYGIWYQLNKLWINIGLIIFSLLFFIVFTLQLLPALTLAFMKPENVAKRAFEKNNYQKAANLAEKALGKKLPIQIQRELLEILVQSHFELKNFVKCQDYAREILEKFPENMIAWGYLAKASMASNDNSSEAIAMYENIYKDNPEQTQYLPVLARHYAKNKNHTVEAMGILFTYYQTNPDEPEIVMALAEGYVQNRSMGSEVITVLEEALKNEDRDDFRELLARNYAKAGRYADASRECLKVLENNLNNMGIHVVYSSSMKKLNMLDEAIAQYKTFLQKSPDNPQIIEILNGLKKDSQTASQEPENTLDPELPPIEGFSDELSEPDLPPLETGPEDIDIEGFVEPPPEGFDPDADEEKQTPLPDFLKQETAAEETKASGETADKKEKITDLAIDPTDLEDLDPFATSDNLLDEFDEELPEELGGTVSNDSKPEPGIPATQKASDSSGATPEKEIPNQLKVEEQAEKKDQVEILSKARELSSKKRYNELIKLLSPVYASERNRETGVLLANALIETNEPLMAMEIIETLDIDPEIISEDIKDILYRTGVALENKKKTDEALKMYDMICNVDINYKDAFDRSDRIYTSKK